MEDFKIQIQDSTWRSLSDVAKELSKYTSYCKDLESEIYDINTDVIKTGIKNGTILALI